MTGADHTTTFHGLVEAKRKEIPEAKRRRLTRPSRRVPGESQREGAPPLMQEYMQEAHNILTHVNTLSRMLANIRKPYLDVHSRHPGTSSRTGERALDFSDLDSTFLDRRHLTNEERDQIDLQVRVILTRCAERVRNMEALEKQRAELAAKEANPLLRMLPARLRLDTSTVASEYVAAHNAAVTWYLTRRLAQVSQQQKELQEERVRRHTERTRTLGSGAAQQAMYMSVGDSMMADSHGAPGKSTGASWILGGASSTLASSFASTIGAPYSAASSVTALPPDEHGDRYDDDDDDDDDYDVELSASQIQQFESENAQILRAVEDTYASVQQAEARLLEISALQMELVAQLTRQAEVTDRIYEDAVATGELVEKGNEQLREARRRARDGRMWILLFLIGASLSLLFLHYY